MRADDFEPFSEVVQDLAVAFNKPMSDRLLRVFFEDLKDQPLGTIRVRAQIWRRTSKKFPTPADLRPKGQQDELVRPKSGKLEPTIQEKLCSFAAKYYSPESGKTTPLQFSSPWKYLYKSQQWTDKQSRSRDEAAVCSGLLIPAAPDGSRPGYRILVTDMEMQAAA